MIKQALANLKITALNEMQQAAIAAAKKGDVVLLSPTGSGKTLGFLLPLLSLLDAEVNTVQALILVPSRELALQIEQVFKTIGSGFKVNCCYGGHPVKIEMNNLSQPPAVLIGTPGRLAHHLRRESFDTKTIFTLVLDEFDKALEFGFQEDMAFIIKQMPSIKKRILTSATKMDEIPAFTHRNGRTARMHATGTSYLLLLPDEKPAYLKQLPEAEILSDKLTLPQPSPWVTLYIAAGKKDKVNKVDVVGLLLQKGGLEKEDLGLIEVLDYAAYAAINIKKIEQTVALLKLEKIKNKKVKIEISR